MAGETKSVSPQSQASADHNEGMEVSKVVRYGLDRAEALREKLTELESEFRKNPSKRSWHEVDGVAWKFCWESQTIHWWLGGLDPEPFQHAIGIIEKFVDCATGLLEHGDQVGCRPASPVRERIEGVIHRSRVRIAELQKKLDLIPAFENAETALLGDP